MLTRKVQCYLALRRAAGFSLAESGPSLLAFARFAEARGDTHVRTETAIAWASTARTPARRDHHMRCLIIFARHAHAEDARHEMPPPYVFVSHLKPRPSPVVFTSHQVEALLRWTLKRPGRPRWMGLVYVTLYRLLLSTGLRTGEALRLLVRDVTADGLVIRETKFCKSRLVPLHPTAAAGLAEYLSLRHRQRSKWLFPGRYGGSINQKALQYRFRRTLVDAGLTHLRAPGLRVGLHNFRHTFAVRALEASPTERGAIAHHHVALATYLGHSSINSTYWYLKTTAELLADIADAHERHGGAQ